MKHPFWCILAALGAICCALNIRDDLQTSIPWAIIDMVFLILNTYFTYFWFFKEDENEQKIS